MPTPILCSLGAALVAAMTVNTGAAAASGPHENIPGPHVDRGVPDYDFQWATVGDVGNQAWKGKGYENAHGHGRVNYRYRISRHEVTTGQWMEFLNTIAPLSPNPFNWGLPTVWGAEDDPALPSGHYRLRPDWENAAMTPVYGISWREAAMYCNWLHAGKPAEFESVLNGVYDTSTFGNAPGGTFTDQPTRSPGARFWIPSLSEWMKAAHYDPDRYGEGEGGWWEYAHTSDTAPVAGPPGMGETMAGWEGGSIGIPPQAIPLGAYTDVQSPWGLWDASGGTGEWTEFIFFPGFHTARGTEGAPILSGSVELDWIGYSGGIGPGATAGYLGLRVASVVPAPASWFLVSIVYYVSLFRRRLHETVHSIGVRTPCPRLPCRECARWRRSPVATVHEWHVDDGQHELQYGNTC